METIIQEVIDAYGGIRGVQEKFHYSSPMAVYNWKSRGLPKAHVVQIHLDTNIPLERLQRGVKQSQEAA